MFWLDRVNEGFEVRQPAALCWIKPCCTVGTGVFLGGKLPHLVGQMPVLGFEVQQAAALYLLVKASTPKQSSKRRTWLIRRTKFLH
jgi:hypothetical protein